jgi:hypothetical protein
LRPARRRNRLSRCRPGTGVSLHLAGSGKGGRGVGVINAPISGPSMSGR